MKKEFLKNLVKYFSIEYVQCFIEKQLENHAISYAEYINILDVLKTI